jgi:hypothetical protein
VPLTVLPEPPAAVQVAYTVDAVTVSWEPSGGVLGFLVDRALPPEAPPFDDPLPAASADGALAHLPSGPTTYNVYREIAPDPLALPVPRDATTGDPAPLPVNPAPLATLSYAEPLTLDERTRCYTVRAVKASGPTVVEGDPSLPACVTPIDVFPPAAPTGLSTVASERAISLIWEPNIEADLAGYLVLRRDAGGDTLTTLTRDGPIAQARFTDETVTAGVRYEYEVVAVDGRVPLPNVSPPARVEETAR